MAGSVKGFQFGAFQFNAFQILGDTGTHSGVNRLALMELYEKELRERAEKRRAELGAPRVTSRIVRVAPGTVSARVRRAPAPRQAEVHEAAKVTYLRPERQVPEFDIIALVREALSAIPEQLVVIRDYAAQRRKRNQRRDSLALQAVMAFY